MQKFIVGIWQLKSGKEYSPSSLKNALILLNRKIKQLKQNRIILQLHYPLTEKEITLIFNYPKVSASHAQGLQYKIFMWMCMLCAPWGGGLDNNGNATSIPILSDPLEKCRPVYDIRLYFSKRPDNCASPNLLLQLAKNLIVNHSGHTTSITHLYQLRTPNSTLMSITGHKSESSVRIYSHPSEQQKKDCLSAIINSSINNIE
ncbi:3517_t:CDS:2, partial [Racocetra persica]